MRMHAKKRTCRVARGHHHLSALSARSRGSCSLLFGDTEPLWKTALQAVGFSLAVTVAILIV